MMTKKTWEEFRRTGLLWWINMILHTFGWAIVVTIEDDGTITEAYPARVKFRGFDSETNEAGYLKVTDYLSRNSAELNREIQD